MAVAVQSCHVRAFPFLIASRLFAYPSHARKSKQDPALEQGSDKAQNHLRRGNRRLKLTLLIQNNDVAAGEIDGVSGTQARHLNRNCQLHLWLLGDTDASALPAFCSARHQESCHDSQCNKPKHWQTEAEPRRAGQSKTLFAFQKGDNLRPPPTTMTLGAMVSLCPQFQ